MFNTNSNSVSVSSSFEYRRNAAMGFNSRTVAAIQEWHDENVNRAIAALSDEIRVEMWDMPSHDTIYALAMKQGYTGGYMYPGCTGIFAGDDRIVYPVVSSRMTRSDWEQFEKDRSALKASLEICAAGGAEVEVEEHFQDSGRTRTLYRFDGESCHVTHYPDKDWDAIGSIEQALPFGGFWYFYKGIRADFAREFPELDFDLAVRVMSGS